MVSSTASRRIRQLHLFATYAFAGLLLAACGGGGSGGDGGGGSGRFSMNQWPQVTFVSGGTESPDETAQGAWLELATKPGLAYVMAHVKFLRDGRYTVERIEEDGQRDTTSITLTRVRPVRPPGGSVKTPRP